MGTFNIRKGRDIKLKGAADKKIVELSLPSKVAVLPQDFRGLKPRLSVKEGDLVKVGSPLITDKINPQIQVVSPASGRVAAINRGDKRLLLQIVIETDGKQEAVSFNKYSNDQLRNLSREELLKQILGGGAVSDGVQKVGLAQTGIPVDEEGVVCLGRSLCHGDRSCVCETV